MNALLVDISTTPQKEIPSAGLSPEQLSRIYRRIGYALIAAWEKKNL